MALKNTKIAREIVQTCNKFLSNKTDIPPPSRAQEISETIQENIQEFRYDVSDSARSPIVPKISYTSSEPEQVALFEMHHLQPATYPKYINVNENPRDEDVWQLHKITDSRKYNIQYPMELLKQQQKSSLVTETFKKNLLKGGHHSVGHRNYSTSPFMIVSRHYVKKRVDEKCEKPKKRCQKGPCPNIGISKKCERSQGSHCEHFYKDPKCKKKMAPYPSFSEACAYPLEDNPSECFQCPWNKCGGTDSIKPPKRRYHTSVRRYSMATVPCHKPCKAPPPKCGEKKKDDKCPGAKKKKRKCDSWAEAYALWSAKENVIPDIPWEHALETPMMAIMRHEKDVRCKFPFDERLGNYEYVKQKPCADKDPGCKKKKFKRVPEGCDPNKVRDCKPDLKNVTYDLKKCPKDKPKCPPKDKQKCPEVDLTIDPRFKPPDPCCQDVRKNIKKGRRKRPKVFVPEKRKY